MLVTNFRLKYSLYKIILPFFQLLDTGRLHPVRERAIRSLNSSVDYIEKNMRKALGFETQKELINFAIASVKVSGYFLEFGVYTGGTIRYMAKHNKETSFHGFDSFEGLPDAWSGMAFVKNTFGLQGKMPKVPRNVVLHKGWFDQTIPLWCKQYPGKIAFMHIDCDLYTSTKTILEELKDRLQIGTVILFDEYFNYPNWEDEEFKAWQEFVSLHSIGYEYIGYARQQVAVKITSIN